MRQAGTHARSGRWRLRRACSPRSRRKLPRRNNSDEWARHSANSPFEAKLLNSGPRAPKPPSRAVPDIRYLLDVADLLGDDEETVREHYARWAPERQARLTSILREAFVDKPRPNSPHASVSSRSSFLQVCWLSSAVPSRNCRMPLPVRSGEWLAHHAGREGHWDGGYGAEGVDCPDGRVVIASHSGDDVMVKAQQLQCRRAARRCRKFETRSRAVLLSPNHETRRSC